MKTIREVLVMVREHLPDIINEEHSGSIAGALGWLWSMRLVEIPEMWQATEYMAKHVPDGVTGTIDTDWWPLHELAPRMEYLDNRIRELE